MENKTSDTLTNIVGIGVLWYGFTKIPFLLRFVVCCGLAIIIMIPIDWCYSAVMGERIFWTDSPPAFSSVVPQTEEEKQEKFDKHWEEEDLWGFGPKDWLKSGKFKKAETIYATSADQQVVNDCYVGNMHACSKLRGRWIRQSNKP